MENNKKFYINGQWVEPISPKTLEVINPANEEAIAEISMGSEEDLNKALNENLIFGAVLDVFTIEPPSKDNPLLNNPKVMLSPHTAAFTEECMTRMGKETIQNIIYYFGLTYPKLFLQYQFYAIF